MTVTVDWEKIARARLSPLCVTILDKFGEGGEWSAKMLAEDIGCKHTNIYYWIGQLKAAGIIKEVRVESSHGSVEHFYVLI